MALFFRTKEQKESDRKKLFPDEATLRRLYPFPSYAIVNDEGAVTIPANQAFASDKLKKQAEALRQFVLEQQNSDPHQP